MDKKYEVVDRIITETRTAPPWILYHNHLMKYKNYNTMHIAAVELYDRHFGMSEEKLHRYSRLGHFIRACITAGYAKAKMEAKKNV